MFTVLIILHIIGCIALILVVLFQAGKGAGMSNVFGGGGGSDTVFGSKGPAGFLAKATTVVAILFMVTSFSLAFLESTGKEGSVVEDEESVVEDVEEKPSDGETTSKLQVEEPKTEERTSKLDEVEEEKEKDITEEDTEKDTEEKEPEPDEGETTE